MKITPTRLTGVLIIEPEVYGDERGFFLESFNARDFARGTGIDTPFVQDNQSRSQRGVLRGLHYQIRQPQGKLLRVTAGAIFDVAVDLRHGSETFGAWFGEVLSAHNHRQLWIPPGCAHGFLVTTEYADVLYKTTDYYAPAHERCIRWDDPDLAIDWPLESDPILSKKDAIGAAFADAEGYAEDVPLSGAQG